MGELLLLRHGQTEWSATGQHTGLTDIPLTELGEQQAREAAPALAGRRPVLVLTSPLQRAHRTAELAGLGDLADRFEVDERLHEWDYGEYEGLTSEQIRERTGARWEVFADGVPSGETLDQVAARSRAVLERVRPALTEGDVLLVGHGHSLRVLAACWLGADPHLGAQLLLEAAAFCVLGSKHEVPAIVSWNVPSPQGPTEH